MRRDAGRISAGGHVGDVEQPLHFQLVRLLSQIAEEILDGSGGVGGLRVFVERRHGENAALAGIAIDIILHFGAVKIGDAERFIENRRGFRQILRGKSGGFFVLLDCGGHVALIRIELTQAEDCLNAIDGARTAGRCACRHRAQIAGEKFFELGFRVGVGFVAQLADFHGILVPTFGFGETKQSGFGFVEAGNVRGVLHDIRRRTWPELHSAGTHVRGSGLIRRGAIRGSRRLRHEFQNGVARRGR